jgi:hypothetical protein
MQKMPAERPLRSYGALDLQFNIKVFRIAALLQNPTFTPTFATQPRLLQQTLDFRNEIFSPFYNAGAECNV